MLEVPESYSIAKQLNTTIKGKTITKATANYSPHKFAWYNGDPSDYNDLLKNKTITGCINYSGMVEIQAEDTAIVFNDGIIFRYLEEGAKLPQKHQLLLNFDDNTKLVCSLQMYGGLCAFKRGTYDNEYYVAAKEKISPLSDEFTLSYFKSLIDENTIKKSAKAFFATEQRIPGLGNGVLQDILFNARINPKTKINVLNDDEIETLFNSVKSTLKEMAQSGGRDTEKDIFGNACGYKTKMSKLTYKEPCPVCGSEIIKQAYMGGSVYFCPSCQKEK